MSKLYLIPNSINDDERNLLPEYISQEITGVRVFFVEEPKSARRLLKRLNPQIPFTDYRFYDLNEHSTPSEVREHIKVLQDGDGAIISEAGCPCVADPGADLVFLAHQHHVDIIPLVGPCSILMALMGSGLNGQNFAFNGYLPRDRQEKIRKIKMLEERSMKERQTQIFMEAPYRNQNMLEDILSSGHDNTYLCIACDISCAHQIIKTMSIKAWKSNPLDFDKKPALFLIDAGKTLPLK
jgi:16S rRNA (cytidine1402-2'-O)-methyltransferase